MSETRPRILLVEDEEMLRSLERSVLENAGFAVDAVGDGVEAVARIQDASLRYDLLICDLGILGVRGEDVIVRAVALRPGIPVIVCTGEPVRSVPHATLLIRKPFSPKDLPKAAREVLASRPDPTQ